jgi:putative sterol carrier protein
MPKFPSEAWALELCRRLNASAAYAESARAWEGDFLLLVAPDATAPLGEGIHLDLAQGRCRSARYVADPPSVSSEFVYRGARPDWERLLRRQIDPVKSLFDGTFKLQGNLLKAMRFQRAAKEMLECATEVPLDP